jgi:rod shape-determining protein MreC
VIFSQLNNKHNQLFHQAKRETLGFPLVLCLALVLMVADGHYHCLSLLRHGLTYITSPLQYISASPVRFLQWSQTQFSNKQALIAENQWLHQQQLLLHEELQRMLALRHENSKLKELLALAEASSKRSIGARVLSLDINQTRQLLIINKGVRHHVYVGQPVLDAHGLLGQVIDVGSMTSTVLLISDGMSAVPVRNNRTSEMGIVSGTNHLYRLALIHLPKTSSVMVGDLLVTSGLGGIYPEGHPVGRVDEVINHPGEEFIRVYATPLASLRHSQYVLLLWPNENRPTLSTHFDKLHILRSYS